MFLYKRPLYVLAPMVDNSGQAWRKLARRYGADLCYTEMVHSANFLEKPNPTANRWYTTDKTDRPLAIQICGNDPQLMAKVAMIVQNQCDMVDINFGCPQNVARRGRYGAYLQEHWKLTSEIVTCVSGSIDIPLSCKIRIFDDISMTVKYAQMIEQSGCRFLAVHGRTREQKGIKTGLASWDHIKFIKQSVKIPVISNGNILEYSDIQKCLEYTKSDGVMSGEPHLYNPLIFSEKRKCVFEIVREYLEICREIPTKIGEVRSHVFKLLHVILDANKNFYQEIATAKTTNEIEKLVFTIKEKFHMTNLYPSPYIRSI